VAEQAEALAWVDVPVPLPAEGRSVAFEVEGARLVLCHADGGVYVVEDRCPHMRAPLAGGRLHGTLLECPLHGGRIDVRDGSAAGRPIRTSVGTFPVRRIGGRIEVALPKP
jgi:nitrite reductase/ring-hydroxylating ferredoxin subunit